MRKELKKESSPINIHLPSNISKQSVERDLKNNPIFIRKQLPVQDNYKFPPESNNSSMDHKIG